MTIEEILAGESKNVEFKENLPEKSIKYMKSVVAFANGTGGKIIFGIADKTRELVICRHVWHMSILREFLTQIFEKYLDWEKKRKRKHLDFLPVLLTEAILK